MARREVIRHVLAGRPEEAERAARQARRSGSNPEANARAAMHAYVQSSVERSEPIPIPAPVNRPEVMQRWQDHAQEDWDRYLMDGAEDYSLNIPNEALRRLVSPDVLTSMSDLGRVEVIPLLKEKTRLMFGVIERWSDTTPTTEQHWSHVDFALLGPDTSMSTKLKRGIEVLQRRGRLHAFADLSTFPVVISRLSSSERREHLFLQRYRDRVQEPEAFLKQLAVLHEIGLEHLLIDSHDQTTVAAGLNVNGQLVERLSGYKRTALGLPTTGFFKDCYLDLDKLQHHP